ncbi:unnamed protein product, partial [Brassica rapa subsp. narinosa]
IEIEDPPSRSFASPNRAMSSESKVEFLPKLVKGLKWEMRSTVGGESKVCGAGREREQRSKHLDKVKALKVAIFVSFHYGWSFDHRHLYHP